MKSGTGIHLENAKELEEMLKAFPAAVSTRAGVKGLRAGAGIMKRALIAASPVSHGKHISNTAKTHTPPSGELKKSWRYKKLRKKYPTSMAFIIELKHRFYYDLMEFKGLSPGERKRPTGKGKNMKQLSGVYRPFAARAIQRSSRDAVNKVMDQTKYALAFEAGAAYARSLRGRKI